MTSRFQFLAALALAAVATVLWPIGRSATAQMTTAEYSFTVVFTSPTLPPDAAASVERAGGRVTLAIPEIGTLQAAGPTSLLGKLNEQAGVQAISPTLTETLSPVRLTEAAVEARGATPVTPDLYNRFQWDIKQVTNDGKSYTLGKGSKQTIVAVLDTGINTQHQDLKANLLGGRNFVPETNGSVNPAAFEDLHGHGSHVAGAIAGNGRILGVGPELGIKAYRVLNAEGRGRSTWIQAAIVAAANEGVDVLNMSIGGTRLLTPYTWTDPATGAIHRFFDTGVADFVAYQRAVQYATSKGAVVVVGAGNSALNLSNPTEATALMNAQYGPYGYRFMGASRVVPATLAGAVTVSATGPRKNLADYSNYGPGAIQVSAPGGEGWRYPAMTPTPWFFDLNLSAFKATTTDPNTYGWAEGTSMAAPKVSAVAALIAAQAKAQGRRLTPAQVVTTLQQTATEMGKPGYDEQFGFGLVNAYMALGGR